MTAAGLNPAARCTSRSRMHGSNVESDATGFASAFHAGRQTCITLAPRKQAETGHYVVAFTAS